MSVTHLLRDFKAELVKAAPTVESYEFGRKNLWIYRARTIAERLVPSNNTVLIELLAHHYTLGTTLPRNVGRGCIDPTYLSCRKGNRVGYWCIFEAIRLNAIDWLVDEAIYWRELQMEEVAMENLNPLLTEGLE